VIARDLGPTDDLLMLQALLDGELDASGVIDMERRIAADPRLAAEYARLRALRGVIQGGAMREAAPESLRARIAAVTGVAAEANSNVVRFPDAAARPAVASARRWRAAAGAMAAAVVALLGVNVYLVSDWGSDDVERAAVAAHSRGLISGQPVDVVSTDRHTVKPWLAGKVPLATTVVDLATDGYALTGGRVDVIGDVPVPTLVYRHREHVVSLTELARGSARPSAPTRETINGHSVVTWSDNVRRYVAVSDMPPPELDDFVATFRRAAASEREDSPPKTK
jgi:anti-sigma factor RsiW